MSDSDLAIVAALIFGWAVLSARLERFDVTAAIIFVAAGVLLTHGPLAPLGITPSPETVRQLAEATLVLVLFSDASRVSLPELRSDAALCLRLLGVALPLSIGLGLMLALALFPGLSLWLALLLGAALAPTDAALGAGLMVNRAVPARIRQIINVESGLNDGIATPFVLLAVAGASVAGAGSAGHQGGSGPARAFAELVVGVFAGVLVGGGGGFLVRAARRRGWASDAFAGSAVLALAACAYASSLALHGNGFIAAFVGGLSYGVAGGRRGERLVPFAEEVGALLSLLVWLAFGAVLLVPALHQLSWAVVAYAVLSLTVVRMVPVALALLGARLGVLTTAFIGWFGPRGLASVIFGLIALGDLGEQRAGKVVAVITVTVLLSVAAHGVTADPLARRLGPRMWAGDAAGDGGGAGGAVTGAGGGVTAPGDDRAVQRDAAAPGAGPAVHGDSAAPGDDAAGTGLVQPLPRRLIRRRP